MASGGKKEIDNGIKLEVRAVLLSKIGGILLRNFRKDFMNLLDHPIKYRDDFGYNSLEDLLRAMPDVVRFVYSDANQDWRMFGVGDNKSFMSKHAKLALGQPGEDVDTFEGKKPRLRRGGRHSQNRRHGGPFRIPNSGRDRSSGNPRGQVPQKSQDNTGIEVDGNGLYPICCPLNGRSEMDVLAEFKTVAKVVKYSKSHCYLFSRFSTLEDATNVMKAFKTKFGLRSVENRSKRNNTERSEKIQIINKPTTVPNGILGSPPSGSGIEIYIGNIPEHVSESDLRRLMNTTALKTLRMKCKDNKRFAFGGFNCQQEALLAVEKLNDKIVSGRRIISRLAHPDPSKAGRGKENFNTPFMPSPNEDKTNMNHQPRKVTSPLNESSTPDGFIPDIDALKQFTFIGVPREQAIAALKAANNDLQDASEWLIKQTEDLLASEKAHMESLQKTQLKGEKEGISETQPDFIPDQQCLQDLIASGIDKDVAYQALKTTNNDLDQAAIWLVENCAELRSLLEEKDVNISELVAVAEQTESSEAIQSDFIRNQKTSDSMQSDVIPNQKSSEAIQSDEIPYQKSSEAIQSDVIPNQKSSEAIQSDKIPNQKSKEAIQSDVIPNQKSSEAIQSDVIPKQKSSEAIQSDVIPKQKSSEAMQSDFIPDQKCLADLIASGINKDTAYQALKTANNDLDQAAVWLIENSTELQSMLEEKNVDIPELISTAETLSVDSITHGLSAVGIENGECDQRNINLEGVSSATIDNIQVTLTVKAQNRADEVNGNSSAVEECNYDDLPPLEIDDEPPELEYYEDDYFSDTDSQSLNMSESSQHVPVYVGRFPSGTKQLDLLELFSEYSPIKIKMINNFDSNRKTFAFVVLGNSELAERAIEEMNGALFEGRFLQVGRAFIDKGYNEPVGDPVATLDETEDDLEIELTSVPESVSFFHTLLEQVWPCAKILNTELFGRLPVDVTCVVDDHYFFGHVLKFKQEEEFLELINTELNGACTGRAPEKRLPEHRCCARYEGLWYRAYNMGSLGFKNTQAVMFLDYGNLEQLSPTEIRRPFLDLFEFPPVIKAFELVGSTVTENGITVGSNVLLEALRNAPHELNSVTRVKLINAEILR